MTENNTGLESNTIDDMWLSLELNAFLFLFFVLFYDYFRRTVEQIYYPKLMKKYKNRLRIKAPPKPPFKFLNWPIIVLRSAKNEEELIKYMGVDAFMFLRFMRLCLSFLIKVSLLSVIVLVPIYSTGKNKQPGLDQFSIGNLDFKSTKLWAPCFIIYLISYFFLGMLADEYKNFVEVRKTFVAHREANSGPINSSAIKQHSVMVENIPEKYQNDAALHAFFEKLFPGQVINAVVTQDLGELEGILEKREVVLFKLEAAIARREGGIRLKYKNPLQKHRIGGWIFNLVGGTVVDSIDTYSAELSTLNDEVCESQEKHLAAAAKINTEEIEAMAAVALAGADEVGNGDDDSSYGSGIIGAVRGISTPLFKGVRDAAKSTAMGVIKDVVKLEETVEMIGLKKAAGYCSTGFVTFKSFKAAAASRQMLLEFGETSITGQFPPEPRDVKWKNITMSGSQTRARELVVDASLTWGIVAWGSIVTLINSLTSIGSICKKFGKNIVIPSHMTGYRKQASSRSS